MNTKGFFFTIDSMLALAVVGLLLGSIAIMGLASQKSGTEQALLQSTASDNADKGFLRGQNQQDAAPPASVITANCRGVYEYMNNNIVGDGTTPNKPKVKRCTTLG